MLHVAPAVLIAAAVTATQPVPARPPISDEERRTAQLYLTESVAMTRQLGDRAKRLGGMLAALLQGQAKNGNPIRAELKAALSFVDQKTAYFKTKPAPKFSEMSKFRTVFLDYLGFERQFLVTWIGDSLKVLEDPKLGRDEKKRLLIQAATAHRDEEQDRALDFDVAVAALSAAASGF